VKTDEGVSDTDTTRRSEQFAAENLELQSKGCFLEVPLVFEVIFVDGRSFFEEGWVDRVKDEGR
jgi:hypothetical protein